MRSSVDTHTGVDVKIIRRMAQAIDCYAISGGKVPWVYQEELTIEQIKHLEMSSSYFAACRVIAALQAEGIEI